MHASRKPILSCHACAWLLVSPTMHLSSTGHPRFPAPVHPSPPSIHPRCTQSPRPSISVPSQSISVHLNSVTIHLSSTRPPAHPSTHRLYTHRGHASQFLHDRPFIQRQTTFPTLIHPYCLSSIHCLSTQFIHDHYLIHHQMHSPTPVHLSPAYQCIPATHLITVTMNVFNPPAPTFSPRSSIHIYISSNSHFINSS